ncbi:hypothetical protein [Maridesulfovibrio frigidus]|uniref:hypothetical protein n=1 Tax=Maridesulfovibrio frigidus TaxID=340956 RepID=UPI0004E1A082|nr:hypothetical protein [Maridesulfovibrio frigidus]
MIDTILSIPFFINAQLGTGPHWDHWPFGPGYGDLNASLLKIAFCALILGFIIVFLRVLFGPKGIFRDHEMDREAEEMRAQQLKTLEENLKSGEISELDYKFTKKKILH